MSYNCDIWKTKILQNFRLPIASLFIHNRKDWHPDREDKGDGTVEFAILENTITGTIEGEDLIVSAIDISGEGSGTAWVNIIQPALLQSTGHLIALRVWEGGDSIDLLTVQDGIISEVEIEI